MKPIKSISPWFTIMAIPPLLAFGAIIYAIYNSAFFGVLLSLVFLLFWFRFWQYRYDYFEDRIVIRRFVFSNTIINSNEISHFEERPILPRGGLDHAPQLVTVNNVKHTLPCGLALDQMKMLQFLSKLYKKEVIYL
jgi:hypothetical protein